MYYFPRISKRPWLWLPSVMSQSQKPSQAEGFWTPLQTYAKNTHNDSSIGECFLWFVIIQHDDSSIGVAFSWICYNSIRSLEIMFERVCFNFYDRQRVFKHTYIMKSLLSEVLLTFSMKIERVCLSVYVSFSMTGRGFSNIHTCSSAPRMTYFSCFLMTFESVCWSVYVSFSMTGRGFSNIHTRSNSPLIQLL